MEQAGTATRRPTRVLAIIGLTAALLGTMAATTASTHDDGPNFTSFRMEPQHIEQGDSFELQVVASAHPHTLAAATAVIHSGVPTPMGHLEFPVEVHASDGALDEDGETLVVAATAEETEHLAAGWNQVCVEITDSTGAANTGCQTFVVFGGFTSGFGNLEASPRSAVFDFGVWQGHPDAPIGGHLVHRSDVRDIVFVADSLHSIVIDDTRDPKTAAVTGVGKLNDLVVCEFALEVAAGRIGDSSAHYDLRLRCGPLGAVTHRAQGPVDGIIEVEHFDAG